MWASVSSLEMRLCSLPMRAPPVRSYIHIADPSAFSSLGWMTPPLPNIGMRNGMIRTRCGALRSSRWRSWSAS